MCHAFLSRPVFLHTQLRKAAHPLSYPSAFPAGLHSHWTDWFQHFLVCGLRARLQAICVCCLRDTWRPSCGPWAVAVWLKSSLSLRSNCCRYVAAKEREKLGWELHESLSSNTVCVSLSVMLMKTSLEMFLKPAYCALMNIFVSLLNFSYSESMK